ncbi:MAG: UDP-N-acetylmuramoyl-L-alanine--D-glutamate ligase [Chloroflexota bacterium]
MSGDWYPPSTVDALAGRQVLVLGLGLHGGGIGATRFLSRVGATVTVTDLASAERLQPALDQIAGLEARLVLGEHREDDVLAADLVIRSPAVPDHHPLLRLAADRGIPVDSEHGLFLNLCPSHRRIGITGSKGKTTTTRMVGRIMRRAGLPHVAIGNLHLSGLDVLDQTNADTIVLAELSSQQIASVGPRPPRYQIAVLTNLYPDHLEAHGSEEAYVEAKTRLFRALDPGGEAFIHRDTGWSDAVALQTTAPVFRFDSSDLPDHWDVGAEGQHNRANAAAALLVARSLGIRDAISRDAIKTYSGEPHRLEQVRVADGVAWIDDSLAGIPEATVAAFATLSSPIIWIVGGRDKGRDLHELGTAIRGRLVAAVLLPGTGQQRLQPLLRGVATREAATIDEAVLIASQIATPGQTVLYSSPFGRAATLAPRPGQGRDHQYAAGREFQEAVARL